MNRPRSRSPLHLDAVGALAARGVLLLVVLGGLAATTAPAQAPPAKNAAACCGADSTYHATWTDPATGQVLGAREPVSIRYVINPAPGWGAGPGDPDGTGQTLHVSPCAVVALYGAGGTDADVCVRDRSAQGLPPEVVVLWEGVQPCVDGAHAGESAVASRYDWLGQLGEVIPTLPRHQVIDFGTLTPGSYTLTFLAHEGPGCCNAGTENVAAQITIVSDPAVSCAAARLPHAPPSRPDRHHAPDPAAARGRGRQPLLPRLRRRRGGHPLSRLDRLRA